MRRPDHLVALGFGAGLSPWAPGTAGSLVGAALYMLFLHALPPTHMLLLAAAATALGIYVCARVTRDLSAHDQPAIVWDEIVGVWIALTPSGGSWVWALAGFAIFRILDIAKPWPISVLDREVSGGLGVMIDDVVAGILTALLLVIGQRLL